MLPDRWLWQATRRRLRFQQQWEPDSLRVGKSSLCQAFAAEPDSGRDHAERRGRLACVGHRICLRLARIDRDPSGLGVEAMVHDGAFPLLVAVLVAVQLGSREVMLPAAGQAVCAQEHSEVLGAMQADCTAAR